MTGEIINVDLNFGPIIVLDCETTIKSESPFPAYPYDPRNYIVYLGLQLLSSDTGDIETYIIKNIGEANLSAPQKPPLLVGQNIKFDLNYMTQDRDLHYYVMNQGDYELWDIGVCEYILSGMVDKFPSLDDMCEKYGLATKNKDIALMWEEGIQTEDIDEDLMIEYLRHDLDVTRSIFLKQLELVSQRDMMPLIQMEMAAMKVTHEIEYNGLQIDYENMKKESDAIARQIEVVAARFSTYTMANCGERLLINSPLHLSAILFGGTIQTQTKERVGVYKTGAKKGQDKWRNIVKEVEVEGIFNPTDFAVPKTKNPNIYRLDQEILESLPVCPVTQAVLEYRKLVKDFSTYYEGYLKWDVDIHVLHPTYNHAATATGRLSCTNPNLQNTVSSSDH